MKTNMVVVTEFYSDGTETVSAFVEEYPCQIGETVRAVDAGVPAKVAVEVCRHPQPLCAPRSVPEN